VDAIAQLIQESGRPVTPQQLRKLLNMGASQEASELLDLPLDRVTDAWVQCGFGRPLVAALAQHYDLWNLVYNFSVYGHRGSRLIFSFGDDGVRLYQATAPLLNSLSPYSRPLFGPANYLNQANAVLALRSITRLPLVTVGLYTDPELLDRLDRAIRGSNI